MYRCALKLALGPGSVLEEAKGLLLGGVERALVSKGWRRVGVTHASHSVQAASTVSPLPR